MEEPARQFRGIWIPAEIWLDENLSAQEVVILAEIDSLDGEDGCYASNDYLARFAKCSASTVSRAISKLKELGYISVEAFDGRARVLRSRMHERQPSQNDEATCNMTRQPSQNDEAAESKCLADRSRDISKDKNKDKGDKATLGDFHNVRLTEEECEKLRERFGDAAFHDFVERLDGYIESTGKRYKSHYATILNWARRDGPARKQPAIRRDLRPEVMRAIEIERAR